jgi:hypothetical protein
MPQSSSVGVLKRKGIRIIRKFCGSIISYENSKNETNHTIPCTSLLLDQKEICESSMEILLDGSGSMGFKDGGHMSRSANPEERSRLKNMNDTLNSCLDAHSQNHDIKLTVFGEKKDYDSRTPKDKKITPEFLKLITDNDFYSSGTSPRAIGPLFIELCKLPETSPVTLVIMTDGMLDKEYGETGMERFITLLKEAIKNIRPNSRCGLKNVVLWIAKFIIDPKVLREIESTYIRIQNIFSEQCISVHIKYADHFNIGSQDDLSNLLTKLLVPVVIIPSDCEGLSGAYWKKDASIVQIVYEVNQHPNGIAFVQELASFIRSLILTKNFPESDIYAKIYRLMSTFRNSVNLDIKRTATESMDQISSLKQTGSNTDMKKFWDKVTEDSTAIAAVRPTLPALIPLANEFIHYNCSPSDKLKLNTLAGIAVRDGSQQSLINLLNQLTSIDCTFQSIDKLNLFGDHGLPIILSPYYRHDRRIARDMMSNFFIAWGLPHILQGMSLFVICLYLIYGNIKVPIQIRDTCIEVLKDYNWVRSVIIDVQTNSLKPCLLAPTFATLMHTAMKVHDFGLSKETIDELKSMQVVSWVLTKVRTTTVSPIKVTPSGMAASRRDVIMLTDEAWDSTSSINPLKNVPDCVLVKDFKNTNDGRRMKFEWLDNGTTKTLRDKIAFYTIMGLKVPNDVLENIRKLMGEWRANDLSQTSSTDTNVPDTNVPDTNVPDTTDTNVPDTNILETRTNQLLEIVQPYAPVPRIVEIGTAIITDVLRAAFPDIFVQGSHMERCKKVAMGNEHFLQPIDISMKRFSADGVIIPRIKINEIIKQFLHNCIPPFSESSTTFTCCLCFDEHLVGNGITICDNKHMVCKSCFSDFKNSMKFEPGSVLNTNLFKCWFCRKNCTDSIIDQMNLPNAVEKFAKSSALADEQNVFKICSVPQCGDVFPAGAKTCADDGAELPSECDAHRKQTSFSCPNCQMQFQYSGGCKHIKCCLRPNISGVRGYHMCGNDRRTDCNHCANPNCNDKQCDHLKGCGHDFWIGAAEVQIGN